MAILDTQQDALLPEAPNDTEEDRQRWYTELLFLLRDMFRSITRDVAEYADHTVLDNLNSTSYYHLTQAHHTDLTDAGDSSLHYHSTDRARANHTGTQTKSTISDFAHALAGSEHNADTLANLNTKLTGSTLLDTTDIQFKTGALHASSDHESGGSLATKLDDLAAPDDNTDLDVSTSAHGLIPKLSNNSGQYLDGVGTWKQIDHTTLSNIGTNTHAQIDSHISSEQGEHLPSGVIEMYGGSSAPTGWLLCDGSAVSRTTYANLYAVIGTTFGVGDGSTTFNLPDFQGAFPRGVGTSTKFTQNHTTTLGTYEDDAMQGHYHETDYWYTTGGSDTVHNLMATTNGLRINGPANIITMEPKTDGVNGTPRANSNETRPNNLGVNFIIKT